MTRDAPTCSERARHAAKWPRFGAGRSFALSRALLCLSGFSLIAMPESSQAQAGRTGITIAVGPMSFDMSGTGTTTLVTLSAARRLCGWDLGGTDWAVNGSTELTFGLTRFW